METTSRVAGEPGPAAPEETGAERAVDGFLTASFPWYGLDEAFTGPRWLMQVGTTADGTVEHGSTGHGEVPSLKVEANPANQRFAVAVTVASRPVRRSADGTGVLEATSVSTAAWLAGSGLLSCTWPQEMERGLRQDWLDQQTVVAWELADDLGGAGWSTLTLPVDGVPTDFHYRESEYGWVLAGAAQEGVHIGAYGRGMSAYGLGFAVVKDITSYQQ
ncbi:hypothetical protein DB35_14435 [Streptomyces abyssalis]|uniref:Uncharacterized protein n=1 Tax=Streptomyces abyssalis TaxID=933944 RepID=A0A1E7JGA7_9ACTN|nr:hypothetical protein [Streptomyces abyssalis]OEU85499.1 hypothetical protein AN215_23570 [Streptomyces abyssalis]OEU93038.1 hypothetical protein DB35_14435 [Streptomyces abyssalis]OEV29617.1 hypothetical protein AN219_15510 [Streptomyces nanshensis]